ncbi:MULTISPECIES: tetratricopeptide repeat protein [unclassified Methylobacterium]|uniref:tetratricopeptide repeat protein n=1 Tax=unclassified Methylobacterium TaxID=2615210 RepID=UPI0012E3AC42|nr:MULTISPECIES: tetratricopeptide repeat protein [unclassified Methylobacterium]
MDSLLPDAIFKDVEDLSECGNTHMQAGLYDAAVVVWQQALRLLPPPQAQWDAALWLHASIGDAFRAKGEIAAALDSFQNAARCADGAVNPFVLFSIGACNVDSGHEDVAVDPFLRAYMLEGEGIFEGQDPEYIKVLQKRNLIDY